MTNNKEISYPFTIRLLDFATSFFREPDYKVKRESTKKFDPLVPEAYENCRDSLRSGDLLFCGGEAFLSKVIRYFSGKSKVSHVGIIFWWEDRVMLLESVSPDGVRIIPFSQYVEDYENSGHAYHGRIYIARHTDLNPGSDESAPETDVENELVKALIKKGASLLNKNFGIKDFFAFFKRASLGRGKHLRDNHFVCSELVERCFNKGIGIEFKGDAGFVAPEHIAMDEKVMAIAEIDGSKGGSAAARF